MKDSEAIPEKEQWNTSKSLPYKKTFMRKITLH